MTFTVSRPFDRPKTGKIGRKVNAMNAGQRRRSRNIGPLDEGMSMRRAHDMAPQAAGTLDIRQVTAVSGEEALILDTAD